MLSFAAWLLGMFAPVISRTPLAIAAATLLLLPAIALFLEAPFHLIGIDGEEGYGVLFAAILSFPIGVIGLTLALLARAKFRPFGHFKQE